MSSSVLTPAPVHPAGPPTSVLLLSPGGALGAAVCATLAAYPRLALGGADPRAVRAAADEVQRVRALHGEAVSPLVLPAGAPAAHVAAATEVLGGLDALVVQLDAPPTGALAEALDALPQTTRAVLVAPGTPPGLGEALGAFVDARPGRRLDSVVATLSPRLGWTAPASPDTFAAAARAVAHLLDGAAPTGQTLRVPARSLARHA